MPQVSMGVTCVEVKWVDYSLVVKVNSRISCSSSVCRDDTYDKIWEIPYHGLIILQGYMLCIIHVD